MRDLLYLDTFEDSRRASHPSRLRPVRDVRDAERGDAVRIEHGDDGDTYLTVRIGSTAADRWSGASGRDGEHELVSETFGLLHHADEQVFHLDGRYLALTPQEYRLLRYLAERPGRLLSVGQISEGAWPATAGPEHAMLRTALCRLRKKLGRAGRLIECQYGRGYLFRGDAPLRPSRSGAAG
jgi:hypothetical protein